MELYEFDNPDLESWKLKPLLDLVKNTETSSNFDGQVPGSGVRVGHPVDVAQAAVDCVSEISGSASCFVTTAGVR